MKRLYSAKSSLFTVFEQEEPLLVEFATSEKRSQQL
jgi:hypothetical protein